jgi:hypothetical protein
MNARIRQLAEQAGMVKILEEHAHEYGNGTFENTPYPELEKFAELIVLKCADIINHRADTCSDWLDSVKANEAVREGQRECAKTIKEHFGVEE